MIDDILASFLEYQRVEGMALADSSDVLELTPLGPVPVRRYLARFHCRGLVWRDGQAAVVERHEIGITFGPDHLRKVSVPELMTWLSPIDAFAPNIRFPFICVGAVRPGSTLVELLEQSHQIITWNKLTLSEHDSLQPVASAWARANPGRFPLDDRPLRRRPLALSFADAAAAPPSSVARASGAHAS